MTRLSVDSVPEGGSPNASLSGVGSRRSHHLPLDVGALAMAEMETGHLCAWTALRFLEAFWNCQCPLVSLLPTLSVCAIGFQLEVPSAGGMPLEVRRWRRVRCLFWIYDLVIVVFRTGCRVRGFATV